MIVHALFAGPGADMSAVKASGLVAGAAGVAGNESLRQLLLIYDIQFLSIVQVLLVSQFQRLW